MPIIVNLDVMLAKRKMKLNELSELVGITPVNLSNLKTGIAGTYHAFKFAKYAPRYLAEYQFRFNRRFDLAGLMQRVIRAAAACKPVPLPALRMAEVRC